MVVISRQLAAVFLAIKFATVCVKLLLSALIFFIADFLLLARLMGQRIISNDSYAHDEQGDNPGQVRGLDGVLYKL